ncbi:NAD(P)/FAD-dependent oxidoreductase [Luteolibacter luteus]|uniref:NAD(P)/FAD-dependent oxidoreductase n=1 Tax=Luteolibacter luteus TaxID=2728835 RepID=A0A858RDM5_9BACT|nr:NAD(P)/FAD-dependent oxidoreductase [Luteolibacter luteus]QJE94688.1 NAD(P)/FAD-dependent oxidoreductase [Luteolibacter luteus]
MVAHAPETSTPSIDCDVVVFGGAFSGSALALLLKRARPETRVLIVEKSEAFDRKVGESTSEVAGCFITRVLGLTHYLSCEHFQKHGLRMWFTTPDNDCPNSCSEIGPNSQARFPTYQLDRAKLDEHMLELAVKEGCELLRPASIKSFELNGAGKNIVVLKHQGETRTIRAGWVADCSGKATLIARQRGTWRKLEDHPVHSMWVRFSNVRTLDCHEARVMAPCLKDGPSVGRASATNHLMGRGWWSWIIPLSNGDFSAGVTWDERLFTPPSEGSIGARVKEHLVRHPIGKLMFEDAVAVENDARIYKHLPYYSTEVCGDGWIMAGDAAGFMDPLYSQGLDYCGHGTYCAHKIILKGLRGECTKMALAHHNEIFPQSYFRWFHGLYRNKYQYLGDADLMHAAFLMDIAAYFIGPVRAVYADADKEYSTMPYNGVGGAIFARFMRFYNRRLETIARKRLTAETYGKNNLKHRHLVRVPFEPNLKAVRHLFGGMKIWLKLEAETMFTKAAAELPDPTMAKEKEKEKVAPRMAEVS